MYIFGLHNQNLIYPVEILRYEVYSGFDDWEASGILCAGMSGELMEVKTQEQYEQALQFRSYIGSVFWLGANDVQNEGVWIWNSTAEEVNMDVFWGDSKPSEVGRCMIMGESGFSHYSCSTKAWAYACQYVF